MYRGRTDKGVKIVHIDTTSYLLLGKSFHLIQLGIEHFGEIEIFILGSNRFFEYERRSGSVQDDVNILAHETCAIQHHSCFCGCVRFKFNEGKTSVWNMRISLEENVIFLENNKVTNPCKKKVRIAPQYPKNCRRFSSDNVRAMLVTKIQCCPMSFTGASVEGLFSVAVLAGAGMSAG